MRRRALLAASQKNNGEGNALYLTLNTTSADNINAYILIDSEKEEDVAGYYWTPLFTNIYVSGTAAGVTFTNAPVLSAGKPDYLTNVWEIQFEGMEQMGSVPVCNLYDYGLLEAYDDD